LSPHSPILYLKLKALDVGFRSCIFRPDRTTAARAFGDQNILKNDHILNSFKIKKLFKPRLVTSFSRAHSITSALGTRELTNCVFLCYFLHRDIRFSPPNLAVEIMSMERLRLPWLLILTAGCLMTCNAHPKGRPKNPPAGAPAIVPTMQNQPNNQPAWNFITIPPSFEPTPSPFPAVITDTSKPTIEPTMDTNAGPEGDPATDEPSAEPTTKTVISESNEPSVEPTNKPGPAVKTAKPTVELPNPKSSAPTAIPSSVQPDPMPSSGLSNSTSTASPTPALSTSTPSAPVDPAPGTSTFIVSFVFQSTNTVRLYFIHFYHHSLINFILSHFSSPLQSLMLNADTGTGTDAEVDNFLLNAATGTSFAFSSRLIFFLSPLRLWYHIFRLILSPHLSLCYFSLLFVFRFRFSPLLLHCYTSLALSYHHIF
jgi:hypothetical protein